MFTARYAQKTLCNTDKFYFKGHISGNFHRHSVFQLLHRDFFTFQNEFAVEVLSNQAVGPLILVNACLCVHARPSLLILEPSKRAQIVQKCCAAGHKNKKTCTVLEHTYL